MKKWRNFYAVFAIALALLLAGCGSAKEVNNEAAETEEKEVETTSNAQDSTYPMTVSPTIAST